MFKKALFIAGLLSVMTVSNSAYADERRVLTQDENIVQGIKDVVTESTSVDYKKGGAIYNSGTLTLDTSAGNITFSGNSAQEGADIYLAEDSTMSVTGNNKVSLQSKGAVAGSGSITNSGIFEVKDNSTEDLKSFTGKYTQNAGKTTLDGSGFFGNFDIKSGELELKNGSNVTLDGATKQVAQSGTTLTIGKEGEKESTLTIGDDQHSAEIEKDVTIVLGQNGKIDIKNGKLTLNNGDSIDSASKVQVGGGHSSA